VSEILPAAGDWRPRGELPGVETSKSITLFRRLSALDRRYLAAHQTANPQVVGTQCQVTTQRAEKTRTRHTRIDDTYCISNGQFLIEPHFIWLFPQHHLQKSPHHSLTYLPMSRRNSSSRAAQQEWEAVEVLRSGPNPRWKCKSCQTNYTGAPRRIAQHILGVRNYPREDATTSRETRTLPSPLHFYERSAYREHPRPRPLRLATSLCGRCSP